MVAGLESGLPSLRTEDEGNPCRIYVLDGTTLILRVYRLRTMYWDRGIESGALSIVSCPRTPAQLYVTRVTGDSLRAFSAGYTILHARTADVLGCCDTVAVLFHKTPVR